MLPFDESDSLESLLEPFRPLLQKRVKFISQVTNRSGLFAKVTVNGTMALVTLKTDKGYTVGNFGPGCVLIEEEEGV